MPPLDPAAVHAFLRSFLDHLDAYGLVGLALGFAAGLMPTRRAILGVSACCSGCFGLHFLGLGSPTGMAMCAVAVAQNLLSYRFVTPAGRPAWLDAAFAASLAFALALTALTWVGWASAFAGTGAVLATLARLQSRAPAMRRWLVAVTACWACHDLAVGSACGLACELTTMAGLSAAILREGRGTIARDAPPGMGAAAA